MKTREEIYRAFAERLKEAQGKAIERFTQAGKLYMATSIIDPRMFGAWCEVGSDRMMHLYTGEEKPAAWELTKIANQCGVTAQWLLGFDDETVDEYNKVVDEIQMLENRIIAIDNATEEKTAKDLLPLIQYDESRQPYSSLIKTALENMPVDQNDPDEMDRMSTIAANFDTYGLTEEGLKQYIDHFYSDDCDVADLFYASAASGIDFNKALNSDLDLEDAECQLEHARKFVEFAEQVNSGEAGPGDMIDLLSQMGIPVTFDFIDDDETDEEGVEGNMYA